MKKDKYLKENKMPRFTNMLKSKYIFFAFYIIKKKQENNSVEIENPTNKVILSSEIVWEKLNPARGDQSPQAGTIWGDRKGKVATGFLAKFVDVIDNWGCE